MPAIADSFRKLAPAHAVAQSGDVLRVHRQYPDHGAVGRRARRARPKRRRASFSRSSLWLWFTVLFANFAEALAEGRSKAQAASLRSAKRDVMAKKLETPQSEVADPHHDGNRSAQGRCRAGGNG